MKYLLDVNVLLAAVWANHPQYPAADAWLKGKSVVVCPLSELGFLRISTSNRAPKTPSRSPTTISRTWPTGTDTKLATLDGGIKHLQSAVDALQG